MKQKNKYWLLILLVTSSLNLSAQPGDTLTFNKVYKNHITLSDFIGEINQKNDFKLELRDKVLDKYKKTKTTDIFAPQKGDENIKLEFLNPTLKDKEVKIITIETILIELKNNPVFKDYLIARFTPKGESDPDTDDIIPLTNDKILAQKIIKNEAVKRSVIAELNKDNLILNYWWGIVGFLSLSIITAWFIREWLLKRDFFKFLNSTFFQNEYKKLKTRNDIIQYLQVKTTNTTVDLDHERLKTERGNLEDTVEDQKKQLNEWFELANGKSIKEIRGILQKTGFYGEIPPNGGVQPQIDDNLEIYYFSSVNRDGDVGIFQDENKSITKEADSLYKFEINKSNPNEAKFWFDATSSTAITSALSYIYLKIEPVCTSDNQFREGNTNIKSTGHGTTVLKDGRWIVEEGNKAKIRYE